MTMTWEDFYLICFLVGFLLSLVSMVTAALNLDPISSHTHHHGGGEFSTPVHSMAKGASIRVAVARASGKHSASHHAVKHGRSASFFSFSSLTAFLAWFGGTGYLLTHYASVWRWLALGAAVLMGLLGAYLVFWFLVRVLLSRERDLDPADYDMVGVLGRISSGIRAGGTGELIYSQAGTRRTCGARSEDDVPIVRGTEVIVTRYERGLAYVRPWEDALKEFERSLGESAQ